MINYNLQKLWIVLIRSRMLFFLEVLSYIFRDNNQHRIFYYQNDPHIRFYYMLCKFYKLFLDIQDLLINLIKNFEFLHLFSSDNIYILHNTRHKIHIMNG